MIVPRPRSDQKQQRRVAMFSTAGIVALAGLVLALVSVPEFTNQRTLYREIDPARLASIRPEPEPETKPEETPQEESDTNEQDTPEEAVEEATPQQAPERVDLSEFSSQGLDVDLSPSTTPNRTRSTEEASASGGNTSLQVEREDLGEIGGMETFNDPNAQATPRGRANRLTTGRDASGIAVNEGTGSGSGTNSGAGFSGGGDVVGGSEGRAGNAAGTSIEVALKDISAFGDNYQNFEIDKLIAWMKQHPGELPPGVRRHVRYQPQHLSSAVPIEIGGTEYDLYLMCKESLYEVHIVLVEGQDTRYLVDRSFQKQSRMFRVGTARRDEGTIVGVQSESRPLGERSEQFYQIFLSWWDQAQEDVES